MKYKFFLLFLSYYINFSSHDYAYPIIAFKTKTGFSRFGDCLRIIHTTQYLSNKFHYPKCYENFNNCDLLEISKVINSELNKAFKFRNVVKIKSESDIKYYPCDTLFEVDVNFVTDKENINHHALEQANLEFKKLIKPLKPINLPFAKTGNCIYVAVHVRKGGGYDLPLLSKDGLEIKNVDFNNAIDADKLAIEHKNKKFKFSDVRWPFKFPPDSFYVEQIKKISELFKNKKIHVHIFTDDPKPENIIEKYSKILKHKNITFSCRSKDNAHDKNIIDDFFIMSQFDCLIRPISYFSEFTEKIGNYKIIIYPAHGFWVDDILIIDKVKFYQPNY